MISLDYHIHGHELQYIEFQLRPGEEVFAEAGALMFMSGNVEMNTEVDTGSSGGIIARLFSVGKRYLSGESIFVVHFRHSGGGGVGKVAFAAPYPGCIVPIEMGRLGKLHCQKDSFLCSSAGIEIGASLTKKAGAGLLAGEGFVLQEISGDGIVFVHAGGSIHSTFLGEGESLKVDSGCVVGFQDSVDFDIEFVGSATSALFGGEGIFFAHLRGPGLVFIQSLPFSRFADRLIRAASSGGGNDSGETSILGRRLLRNTKAA
ncbi:MAG: TIGR00266 family protein [bacterium]|nr:TIGR00266 family protein [bacterium]